MHHNHCISQMMMKCNLAGRQQGSTRTFNSSSTQTLGASEAWLEASHLIGPEWRAESLSKKLLIVCCDWLPAAIHQPPASR